MSRYVVDASVVVKWFLPEVHSEAAQCYRAPEHEILAPDLILPETGNAIWKRVRQGQLPRDEAMAIVRLLQTGSIQVRPSAPYLDRASTIAMDHDRSVYDSLYVALAEQEDCPLVTADRKLFNAMQPTPFARRVRWVETAP